MPNENEQAVETIVKTPVTIPDFPSKLEEEPILWNLLSTHRGNGSKGLQKAMDKIWYLAPEHSVKKFDFQGDLWIDNRQDKSKTLFCAHVDTVEARGKEGTFKIEITEKGIVRSVGRKEIMGVDDGAGVAMLVSLLQANVPGMYLFTHGEECGGNPMRGSILDPLAREPYDRCIAFDRRGDKDIVADQALGVLASEAFVTELAIRLNMGHKWAIGSYTDSSEFKGKIKEIVNVSIGYDANHSAYETLDYAYFKALRAKVLALDWETLPCIGPDPTKTRWNGNGQTTYYTNGRKHKSNGYWGARGGVDDIYDENGHSLWGDDDYRDYNSSVNGNNNHKGAETKALIPLGEITGIPGVTKVGELACTPKDEITAEIDPADTGLEEKEMWALEADILTEDMGFNPDVDIKVRDMLADALKEMFRLGKHAGRKEAFRYMRAQTKITR